MKPAWTTRRSLCAAAALAVLAAGLAAGLLATRHGPPWPVAHGPTPERTAASAPAPAGTPTPHAWWEPLPPATASFVPVQLVIERLEVKAPVEVKGIDARNVMEAPDTGADAAWYRFTARPGAGSNAVFSGHRDFGQLGNPAIFWRLDQLAVGDLVEVVSPQQTEIRYRVTQISDYRLSDIPMAKVLATDPVDEVTLITCAGAFAHGIGYDHRLVVRGVRTS